MSTRLDPRLRGLAVEQHRSFAGLDRPPESLFGGYQDRLVDGIGFDRQLNPLAAAVDDGEHGFLGACHQHVVLELRHMLLRGRLFRKRPRQHEFGLEDGAGFLDQSIQRGGHPGDRPVDRMVLDVTDPVARVLLVPAAVEVLGGEAELDDQHAREVEGDLLTSFLAPEPQQRLFVLAHDDPGVRAADEVRAIRLMWLFSKSNRHWLWLSARFLR
jgi:hypothetical protein